ncbi:cell cycle checkpoint control protein RAD9A isoform X2 [Panulirus ornatus]
MKACLSVFKSLATLERTVERCKLTLDGEEAKLGIQFTCRHGIVKTYNLSFMECETLKAVYDKSSCPNYIQSQSRVMSDAVLNFQLNQEEVTLYASPEKTVIRNYVDDEPDPGKAIHTVLTLEAGEFDGYNISSECEVTFCLKELRAMLTFAELVNLPITTHFSDPGSPIIFTVDNSPMFEGTFVFATLSQKADSQISRSQSTGKYTTQTLPNQQGPESPSSSQTASVMNRIRQSAEKGIRTDLSELQRSMQVDNTPSKIYEKRVSLSPAENSAAVENQTHKLNDRSAPHSPSVQLTNTVNNGNATKVNTIQQNLNVNGTVEVEEEDIVPGTPPFKKARFLFRRCFESTFDPETIPGHDRILAEDSDDDS